MQTRLRTLTWNLDHRAAHRAVPEWVLDEIDRHAPDLVVLTEFVAGDSNVGFISDLRAIGLQHALISTHVPRQNQILVASRFALALGPLQAPPIHPSAPPNFLHVLFPQLEMQCLAVRVPYGGDFNVSHKRALWDWLAQSAAPLAKLRAILTGDLNTDPGDPSNQCGDYLQRLVGLGWICGTPSAGASYGGPSGTRRIDHLYVSSGMKVNGPQYDWSWIDKSRGKRGHPDHAILISEVLIPA
ncbi:endonuclease/exonuclease/phosphatase family protein [Ramlibacter sp.]|uniref:endonuclease/exonuclease/phosphatase family protein n=1 Tax=Ramlibacter sp. TaxID=1917967 RepID=UPI003FA6C905